MGKAKDPLVQFDGTLNGKKANGLISLKYARKLALKQLRDAERARKKARTDY